MSGDAPGGGRDEDEDDRDGRSSYLVLVAVIAAVLLLYWLADAFYDWNKTQTCVGFGKRNCAPAIQLETPAKP